MRRNWLRVFLLVVSIALPPSVLPASQQAGSPEGMGKFFGARETEYPSWFKVSFLELEEDVQQAAEAGKRLLILFHQDGCPYCNALVERNLSQKEIEQELRDHFDVVALNMWGDREVVTVDGQALTEKTFAAALEVQFTPTLLFLNEKGEVILRLNGYLPPERFALALDYAAAHREGQMSFRDYLALHAPAPSSGELRTEDFFSPPPHDLARRDPERPLAVLFEQRDCPSCDALHSGPLQDPEVRDLLRGFRVVQLDMWSAAPLVTPSGQSTTARDWARELDVKYAPSIVLFDASGREILRAEAFFKTFHTQSILDYVRSGAYAQEPSFQRYVSARADRIREQGKDVDIWE